MPNKYRFILGKRVDTSVNLVTNGTFTGSATGWTITTGIGGTIWSYSSNEARAAQGTVPVGALSIDSVLFERSVIYQAGIVSPGTTYWLSYDLRKQSGTRAHVTPSVGGVYYNPLIPWDDKLGTGYDESLSTSYSTYIHENVFCHHGNDLAFFQGSDSDGNYNPGPPTFFDNAAAIDNIILYPYTWNDPLEYEPIDWDKAKITKKRDDVLNGLIVNYIADLTFIEDGYDYLYNLYLINPTEGEVPIRIEIYNSETLCYDKFYEGFIFINECEFNLTNRQVRISITDSNSSQLLIKGRNIKVNMGDGFYDSINRIRRSSLFPTPSLKTNENAFIIDDAGSATCYKYYVAPIYNLLQKMIFISTNYRLDFDSSFFGSGGDFEGFCLSLGGNFRGPTVPAGGDYSGAFDFTLSQFPISLEELYRELNNLFNLTFAIDNSGNVPKVLIETKLSYLNSSPVLSLSFVNDLKLTTDNNNLVKTVKIGYEYVDDSPEDTGLNTPDGIQFKTTNPSADKELNLVSKYIQSSSIIKKLAGASTPAITGNKYDKTFLWLETDGVLSSGCAPSSSNDYGFTAINSGSGTYDLNINIDAEDNIQRQIDTLTTDSLKSFYTPQSIYAPSNPVPKKIYSFSYPVTKSQFDSIVQAYNTIQFNTDGTGLTTKTGYLLEANYDINTGITEFKLLA